MTAVVIGGGPAGLMAAEQLANAGIAVDMFDAMPSVGRKFLLAGIGGLNLTHAEPLPRFLARYDQGVLGPHIESFAPQALRDWAKALGIDTFVGTSQRVFPTEMKAAPLLRAWLHRLRATGVRIHTRHQWLGWSTSGALRFATAHNESEVPAAVTVLALGGASWARLGSDGAWVPILAARGIAIAPLRPANCGFDVGWSDHLRTHFAGQPLKSIAVTFDSTTQRGEFVLTETGVEGSLIYAFAARLRDAIERDGHATFHLDIAPDRDMARLIREISQPRGSRSMANHLRGRTGIDGVKAALLRELAPPGDFESPERLARSIKSLPVRVVAPRPIDEAISTAGGVRFDALDEHLMLKHMPGVFCAGEMLDWEAPTGGYLLTACFATGKTAGAGAARWLLRERVRP